jgi:hypothetical protein
LCCFLATHHAAHAGGGQKLFEKATKKKKGIIFSQLFCKNVFDIDCVDYGLSSKFTPAHRSAPAVLVSLVVLSLHSRSRKHIASLVCCLNSHLRTCCCCMEKREVLMQQPRRPRPQQLTEHHSSADKGKRSSRSQIACLRATRE